MSTNEVAGDSKEALGTEMEAAMPVKESVKTAIPGSVFKRICVMFVMGQWRRKRRARGQSSLFSPQDTLEKKCRTDPDAVKTASPMMVLIKSDHVCVQNRDGKAARPEWVKDLRGWRSLR